jgi:hypothetical protein
MSSLKVGGMYRVPWRTWVCLTSGHDTNLEEGKLAFVLSQVPHEFMKQVIRVRVLCPSGDIGYVSIPCSGLVYWKELSLSDAPQTSP